MDLENISPSRASDGENTEQEPGLLPAGRDSQEDPLCSGTDGDMGSKAPGAWAGARGSALATYKLPSRVQRKGKQQREIKGCTGGVMSTLSLAQGVRGSSATAPGMGILAQQPCMDMQRRNNPGFQLVSE